MILVYLLKLLNRFVGLLNGVTLHPGDCAGQAMIGIT